MESEYVEIAKARILHVSKRMRQEVLPMFDNLPAFAVDKTPELL
jgi:hypothetical protein